MGTDVRDALVQEWRSYLRVKQVYPLLKSSSERGIFSSPIFGTHLETAPLCQGSMSPPSIRKPLNVNGEQNFWLAPRHAAPVSLIAEEPCKCPDPSSYQRSHHSVNHSQDLLYSICLFSSLPCNQRTHQELLWKRWVEAMAVVLQLIPGQIRKGCRYSLGREEIRKI